MLHLAIRSYHRPFRTPLQTHHGVWAQREGIILRLEDDNGQVGFGEIAPIPWFGTETLEIAADFCTHWLDAFLPEQMAAIPDTLPACQFGFATAIYALHRSQHEQPVASGREDRVVAGSHHQLGVLGDASVLLPPDQICGLLPAGAKALEVWVDLWQKGHRTFKWKIGMAPILEELSVFRRLVEALPTEARLRLDANGGLTSVTAECWLAACDATCGKVEFLEQPLPPALILDWILVRAGAFRTAIALDESVATLGQLQQVCQRLQAQGVYVVKPAIAGFPERLKVLCTRHHLDVVYSSALETPVGRNAVLALIPSLDNTGRPQRALGFGVKHWFQDDWDSLSEEALWQRL